MNLSRLKTIFWDLDGTLAYWRSLFVIPKTARLLLSLRPPEIGFGKALLACSKAYIRVMRNPGPTNNNLLYDTLVSRSLGISAKGILLWTKQLLASSALPGIIQDSIRPIPEAQALVETLARNNWRQTVATNPVMPKEFNRLRLSLAGFQTSSFSYISGSEDFFGQKTSVTFFHRLLEISGNQPEECLMIGNDPRKDLLAREAGILVFLLDTPFTVRVPYPESCRPDWVGGYADLAKLFEGRPGLDA